MIKNFAILLALAMGSSVFAQVPSPNDIVVTGVSTVPAPKKVQKGYDRLGRSEYECIYKYDVIATKKNGEKIGEEYATILQFNPKVAKFSDMATYRVDSVASIQGMDMELIDNITEARDRSEFFFSGEVYQNYPEGSTTYDDIITPNYAEYEENFAPFEWEITEDSLTVCSYPCIKATCEYGGRKWIAWFTEEIPASYGPWKFSGLPGLIMKETDSEGVHTFTAKSFAKSDTEIVKVKNVNVQRTTRDKFVSAKNYLEEDPMKRISPESISQIDVFRGGAIRINGVPLIKRKNGYTPIEIK